MERFQQENRYNNSTKPVFWDNEFAPSTLQRHGLVASQSVLSTRDSRGGAIKTSQSARKHGVAASSDARDGAESSPDECDFLSQTDQHQWVKTSKMALVPKQKNGRATSNATSTRPPRPVAAVGAPSRKRKSSGDPESEDEIAKTPPPPVAKRRLARETNNSGTVAPIRAKGREAITPNKREEKRKEVTIIDIQELSDSYQGGDMEDVRGKTEVRRKAPEAPSSNPRAQALIRTKGREAIAPNKRAKRAEGRKEDTIDIQELPGSDQGSDMKNFRGKTKTRRDVLESPSSKPSYTPRPFPMDLSSSPVMGSSRATSTTPRIIRAARKAAGSPGTGPRQREVESTDSSNSDTSGLNFTYTQAVRVNEVDPNLLCPFCDDRLPEMPSPILTGMLENLKLKAKPDPRYGNSLGLKLDMSQYISFCARHTAESEEFPKGQKYGWPSKFDVPQLTKRIWKLQSRLQEIINDPKEGIFFAPLRATALKYGKSAVTGAKGSWATFENASAGYYGEQGLSLITQILFDMFPSIPSENISPLDLSSYYSLVLVPETALLLIQEDLEKKKGNGGTVTRSQALKVLRKSTKYGLAIFPVTEGDQPNAGDDIARQRAKKMRRLRDQEEELFRTSSQSPVKTGGIGPEPSSDPELVDHQAIPVQQKRRAQPYPLEEANGGSKTKVTAKGTARKEPLGKTVEAPGPSTERKVSKKRNLTYQPADFAWPGDSTAIRPARTPPVKEKDSFEWLISPIAP